MHNGYHAWHNISSGIQKQFTLITITINNGYKGDDSNHGKYRLGMGFEIITCLPHFWFLQLRIQTPHNFLYGAG